MPVVLVYIVAALCEIAGCFAFWAVVKQHHSPLWLIPGLLSLIGFAWVLTSVESEAAGRAFAAYGGIYILASLGWMWLIEGVTPRLSDGLGVAVSLIGAAIIFYLK